jgi:hypothetical protein
MLLFAVVVVVHGEHLLTFLYCTVLTLLRNCLIIAIRVSIGVATTVSSYNEAPL